MSWIISVILLFPWSPDRIFIQKMMATIYKRKVEVDVLKEKSHVVMEIFFYH